MLRATTEKDSRVLYLARMKRVMFYACMLWTISCAAQDFQQSVAYTISVTVDTRAHMLRGAWEMIYHNSSPDTLHHIVLHLWPNAYRDRNTAFARQQLRHGSTHFHFATQEDRGYIDSLAFRVGEALLPWALDPRYPDVATLHLVQPLCPGDSVRIASPMRIKLPAPFSRLGHIGDTYQCTQWYPKPAVYDRNGWNAMPYLSQGEFFSEFGSYDVRITLPSNYLVAATGTLHSEDARQLLYTLASANHAPLEYAPPDAPDTRTWHFTADDVHDFAWFADKRFAVRRDETLISGKTVTTWAFFTATEQHLWENATGYLIDALQFMSRHVGDYPYPQMTAVQIPDGADYGMEYPMITSINRAGTPKDLDDVLMHEVGHNWFYGMLATNERKHPWMDEGMTSFYEHLYLREKYGDWSQHFLPWKANAPDAMSDEQRMMQYHSRKNYLCTPDTDPEYNTEMQNFFGAYFKPALAFDMLRTFMGEDVFDRAIRAYFTTWKFRHPSPSDLQAILAAHCDCDLGWFFDGLIRSARLIDYRIEGCDATHVAIENRGDIEAPVHILGYRGDEIVYSAWHPGFSGKRMFDAEVTDADRVQVYHEIYSLDATPHNNVRLMRNGKPQAARLKVRMIGGKEYPGERYLNLLPVLLWNHTDRFTPGLAISNTYWPPRNLQWGVVPLFSTETRSLTGAGEVRYTHFPKTSMWNTEFAVSARSSHYRMDKHYGFSDRYTRGALRIRLYRENAGTASQVTEGVQYRYVGIRQRYGQGIDFDLREWEERTRSYGVHELQYHRARDFVLFSHTFTANAHVGRGFARLTTDLLAEVTYAKRNKRVYMHAFGGWLPVFDNPHANVLLHFNGIPSNGVFSRDYLYDEVLPARDVSSGVLSQVVFHKDARLKTLYNGGISDRWMMAAGLACDIPLPLPVRPYLDVALYNDPFGDGAGVSYSGGLAIIVQKKILEIYVPLVESKDIRNSITYFTRDNVFKRISILLDFKALHPFNIKGY